jgi:hypothetical protein
MVLAEDRSEPSVAQGIGTEFLAHSLLAETPR